MKTVAQLTVEVQALTAESKKTAEVVVKVGGETGKTLEQVNALNEKILELQKQIADGVDITGLETAIGELATQSAATLAQAQATDDLIPDPVPPVE